MWVESRAFCVELCDVNCFHVQPAARVSVCIILLLAAWGGHGWHLLGLREMDCVLEYL